jgi:hypothetical protein
VRKTASKASSVSRNDKKNLYKSSRQYTDRNSKNFEFPDFDVKVTKIATVLLLLSSDESDVVEKVKNACVLFLGYAKKSSKYKKSLHNLQIMPLDRKHNIYILFLFTYRPSIILINLHRSDNINCMYSMNITFTISFQNLLLRATQQKGQQL